MLLSSDTIDLSAAEADTFPNSAKSGEALVTDVSSGRIAAVLAGSGGGTFRFKFGGDGDNDVGAGRSLCGIWGGGDPASPPSKYDDSVDSLLDPGFFHNRYTF